MPVLLCTSEWMWCHKAPVMKQQTSTLLSRQTCTHICSPDVLDIWTVVIYPYDCQSILPFRICACPGNYWKGLPSVAVFGRNDTALPIAPTTLIVSPTADEVVQYNSKCLSHITTVSAKKQRLLQTKWNDVTDRTHEYDIREGPGSNHGLADIQRFLWYFGQSLLEKCSNNNLEIGQGRLPHITQSQSPDHNFNLTSH